MTNISQPLNSNPKSFYIPEQPCIVRDVIDRIGDRWSVLILLNLSHESRRFNQLVRDIGDISKQMLSRSLKKLEEDGFIQRVVTPSKPPQVEYFLTDLGCSLMIPLQQLIDWAELNQQNINQARQVYKLSE